MVNVIIEKNIMSGNKINFKVIKIMRKIPKMTSSDIFLALTGAQGVKMLRVHEKHSREVLKSPRA